MLFSKRVYTFLLCTVACTIGFLINAQTTKKLASTEKPRRIEVLFIGCSGHHKPIEKFRTIRRAHGIKGINYTYANVPTALNKENLAKYDAVLVYSNNEVMTKDQEVALLDFSTNGGACVFLHCACGCFRNSEAYIKLLGAQFESHGGEVFRPETIKPDHPVMKGYQGFECWDETYIHQKHNEDRVVLQMRGKEPWTWVRTNGKGRVFYTASGHDDRCWNLPEYQDLVYRGLMWTLNEKADLVTKLDLPKLDYYTSEVNIIPSPSWGTPLDRKIPHDQLQNPLSTEDSMKLAQVPAGMELQLVASEPMVKNPIAIGWDVKGRMWVVEAFDYPNNFVMNTPGKDRIKILEDTDKDGKADKVSIFAEGLSIATTVLPIDGGCITINNGEMIFLADTDGDGKSDKRSVIFGGISLSDTHATVSNVRLGFDGWIYGTVGYSGIKTEVAGKKHDLSKGVFRFKADGSAFEAIQPTSNNTWGLGFNEQGRILGSTANNNPSFFVGMPIRHYEDAGVKPEITPRADEQNFFYPNTFDYLQVDQKDRFTAAAGHAIYTARLFDKEWWNRRALICDPTGKLVSAPIVHSNGAGFKISNTEQNIYASSDAWSAPVAAEVGPDGAIYIADWYNSIVQHNVYGPNQERGKGNAYISKHRDLEHGRIYRIMPKNATVQPFPKLETAEQQLAALSNDNLFWRLQAQHLLVKGGKENIPALQIIATSKSEASNRTAEIHAQYALAQLDVDVSKLTHTTLEASIISNSKPTAENAIKWLAGIEKYNSDQKLATLLLACDVDRNQEIFKILNEKKLAIQDGLSKDVYLSHVMEIAIRNHGEKQEVVAAPVKKPLSDSAIRGKEIYARTCVACHQPEGEGTPKVFPPLSASEWLKRNPKHAIMIVTKGLTGPVTVSGQEYNGVMPAHADLTDEQVMDVINYSRNAFAEQLGDITIDQVKQVKEKYKDRVLPFTQKEIEAEK